MANDKFPLWSALAYVDIRLSHKWPLSVAIALKDHLVGRPETTSFSVDTIDNGQQKCHVVVIGTTNSRTTQRRVREFFHGRQFEFDADFQGKGEKIYA